MYFKIPTKLKGVVYSMKSFTAKSRTVVVLTVQPKKPRRALSQWPLGGTMMSLSTLDETGSAVNHLDFPKSVKLNLGYLGYINQNTFMYNICHTIYGEIRDPTLR